MFEQITRELIAFIEKSPSCYHVAANFCLQLQKAGFTRLYEGQPWNLARGGRYFVTRADSSLIAFQIPKGEVLNFQITASHSDSPTFKVKEDAELPSAHRYVNLNVERYGGMIYAPWLDRPLSIAGKAVVKEGNKLAVRLVNFDRDLVLIPNLAVHLNPKINDGYPYQPQEDLLPLFGDETAEGAFLPLLAKELKTEPENILGSDLFLYCRTPGTIWGARREFFSSPRLDDLQCAYAAMRGFLSSENPHSVTVCCVFDNEEVGSHSRQGAASSYLTDTLERISTCLGRSDEQHKMAVSSGFLLSLDNAHALHPLHPEKSDPVNRPALNRGPVIKYHAGQKYQTDAVSAAVFKSLCENANVPYQTYENHSDLRGGSTLGCFLSTQAALHTADIGLPQLAMHSPYETGGVKDTAYLISAIREFYSTFLREEPGGVYSLEKEP